MPSNNNHNIYELRSSEVQEVMNKPPGRLITWGNTVIFLTLIIGFWLLTLFRLPVTYETPVEVSRINSSAKTGSFIELTAHKNSVGKMKIPFPTTGKLFLDDYPSNRYGSMAVIMDSVSIGKNMQLFITPSDKDHNHISINKLHEGMSGRISIKTGKESVFKKISAHIF